MLGGGDLPPALRQVAVEVVLSVWAFVDFERLRVRQDRDVAGVPRVAFAHHDVGFSGEARMAARGGIFGGFRVHGIGGFRGG